MTTFLTAHTLETEPRETGAQESGPGCGCCIPPPDSVDTRVALLEERRQRLEARLRRMRA